MSLISLSSDGQLDNADFRNFFYKGIKLKPNSQVACVSSVMNYSQELVIDDNNDTFIIQVGQNPNYNEGFSYKIPHRVYTPSSLVSTINTNILTTLNVSYLRGSTVSGGIKLNFNSVAIPPDILDGVNFTAEFTPLQANTSPTCVATEWFGNTLTEPTVDFGSNADGTTITKNAVGDDGIYDGIFNTENALMENQHLTFTIKKTSASWLDNDETPLGIYGIFSSTDFINNEKTKFISKEKLDNYSKALRPLFGFLCYQDDEDDIVILEHIESAWEEKYQDENSYRINEDISTAEAGNEVDGTIELDDAEDEYYIRIWLGQDDDDNETNNSAHYLITTSAPNDTFVASNATWKSWMKFGTKFYPLTVGGAIATSHSEIALKMCATDKNLSTEVLDRISKEFNPSTWKPFVEYNYKENEKYDAQFPQTDTGTSGGRPERDLAFGLGSSNDFDKMMTYGYKLLIEGNFDTIFNFAPLIISDELVATGNYTYNNTNFKTGKIDKPYTTAQPSLHIQLTNLPIQSYNGTTSSVIRTIAVIPRQRYNGFQGNWTATNINWIDINNAEELIMNELSIRITDNSNKVIENLSDDTEVVLMFK